MKNKTIKPEFIFEVSWEVCNKIGGIYTVLSSKAKAMQSLFGDEVIFIGPDFNDSNNIWFAEDKRLSSKWVNHAKRIEGLEIRMGRWFVPGRPKAILINFNNLYYKKDDVYARMWNNYGVDSLHAYGDYDEASIFGYAASKVILSYYKFYDLQNKQVLAHFHEWMTAMGLLNLKTQEPKIATLFTTHATTLGRSIAGNMKPLYDLLETYDDQQIARELNVEAKHSVEKAAAREADCFTTVSPITARECEYLLHTKPFITPNGFEKDFIPEGDNFDKAKKKARKRLIEIAEHTIGENIPNDAFLIATSGRYEYRNKGIDLMIDALSRTSFLQTDKSKEIIAFIMVPAWVKEAREDLILSLNSKAKTREKLFEPYITHWINNGESDPIINQLKFLGLTNIEDKKVKVIFVPSYLNGNDGIFNMSYYDLLIGFDLTLFPSYYEPWGYTPHESIAFGVPTVTTNLAGFGKWMNEHLKVKNKPVEIIERTDSNFEEASDRLASLVFKLSNNSDKAKKELEKEAIAASAKADWLHFFKFYEEAYSIALKKK